MTRASIVVAAGLLTTVLGCQVRLQSHPLERSNNPAVVGAGSYAPGRTPLPETDRDMGDRGLPAGRPTIAGGRMIGDGLTVCRTDARPRGWIAVAYVAASGQCAKRASRDSLPMTAVLTRYADLPTNTILEVCADEGVPRGWVRERTKSSDATDSCPGGARDGSTTRLIRRLR